MIDVSLRYWGVALIGLLLLLLVYQIAGVKFLRIRHAWLPLFWIINYYVARGEKSGRGHLVYWLVILNLLYSPVILHRTFRILQVNHPIATEFGIWKQVEPKSNFSWWLPVLAHKEKNLTILSFVCWAFGFHCMANLFTVLYFPRVSLVDGLKVGFDSEGRLVSKIKWTDLKFEPIKRFLFFKNPSSRHIIPFAARHGKMIKVNIAQETMFGMVGGTNSGKTSAACGFCSSVATVDEQTLFIFGGLVKDGADYRMFECDPRLVYSGQKPEEMRYDEWQRKQARLPNVIVIDNDDTFVRCVQALDYEIEYRKHVLKNHLNCDSLYDLEDPRKTDIKNADRFNPPRIFRIFMVVDDWVVLRDEYKRDAVGQATTRLLEMVSFARFVKIHLLFISQKATIADYFPGAARDQLFWFGFCLPENQTAYVFKKEVNLPNGIGVAGFIGSGVHSTLGIGCMAGISRLEAAMVLTNAAERMVSTDWGKENCRRMLAFRARCEGDAGPEVMERCSQGQRTLLSYIQSNGAHENATTNNTVSKDKKKIQTA